MDTTDAPYDAVAALMRPQGEDAPDDPTPEAEDVEETEAEIDVEGYAPEAPEDDEAEAEDADSDEDDGEEDADDDEEDDDAEDDEEPTESHTVKVDGEEVTVSLDELKRSYSGQTAIQARFREAAEARQQVEQARHQLDQYGAQLAQMYERVQQTGFVAPPQPPDREMLDRDPIGYIEAKDAYERQAAAYQRQQAEMHQLQERQTQAQREQMVAAVREEQQRMLQRHPDLADPKKGTELKKRLARTAVESYGFSEEEIGTLRDSRIVDLLMDAMKWKELKRDTPKAAKKAESARPLKPSKSKSRPRRQRADRIKQATQSQSADAWVDALLDV